MRRSDKLLLIAKGLHRAECAEADRDLARRKLPPAVRWADPWHPSGCGIRQQLRLGRDAEVILASLENGVWHRRLWRFLARHDRTPVAAAVIAAICALTLILGTLLGGGLLACVLIARPAVACPEGQGDYYTDAKQGLCEDLEEMDQYRHYDNDDQQYQHRHQKGKKK